MPITSNNSINLPSGEDTIVIGLNAQPTLKPTEIDATTVITTYHVRADANGVLTRIGNTTTEVHNETYVDAGFGSAVAAVEASGNRPARPAVPAGVGLTDPAVATLQAEVTAAMQKFMANAVAGYPAATAKNPNSKALAASLVTMTTALGVYCAVTNK